MNSIIDVQKRLLPDLIKIMQKRYQILRYIQLMQPVGRRSLSQSLNITERVLRGEIQFLKEQNLLSVANSGMSLTEEGKIILGKLEHIMRDISGLPELEDALESLLDVSQCIVVSGDSEESAWVKSELGRACLNSIKSHLKDENIIAVTGGTTMAAVADALTPDFGGKNLLFVPARGGIGTDIKNQANTICEKMAEKSQADHMVLYVPDQVSEEVYNSFIQEPSIRKVLGKIKSANILIHGIGDALTMAKRRNTSEEDLQKIIQEKAVAEAFGYYFNENGDIVHSVQTVGLQLEDLEKISHIYAVAGGATKVKAIKAYMKFAPKHTVLVTDEVVTKSILKG
ncbi:hypothetical protein OEV98_05050 [Caldibacillus lycopersici]|uniref:Sugar-binding domain-containing protein n=1 Tax=Perspicuibacillus lycopersici TaxID=1325689 RepID=A0AAE3IR56_9BACI|nr:sugar-binding domain-containing protein [Perspicuibacillus lycopersici]MCU9612916.1 hypothetical protein [Perspicuibacillus lycopersici]